MSMNACARAFARWSLILPLVLPCLALSQTTPSPEELVRRTIKNEISAANGTGNYMFKDYKETPTGSQTKLVIETRDATAGLVIAYNGKPLTQEQRSAELARVERFVNNPDELHKKQRQEKEDAERVNRIMKALPDAFLYQADGTETGTESVGKAGDPLVRLKFRPNPDYNPPTHTEQVLTGMSGFLLVDANRNRIARIDGTLTKDVGFGWGILGHLDKGGRFLVEQVDVGDDHWEVSRMNLSFTGKVLFFKNLNIKSSEIYSDFRKVPSNLTFAQGVELLKKQEAELAENHPQK